jgi:hypothetical protein
MELLPYKSQRRLAGEGGAEATSGQQHRPPFSDTEIRRLHSRQQQKKPIMEAHAAQQVVIPPTDDELGPGAVGSVCSPKATNATSGSSAANKAGAIPSSP